MVKPTVKNIGILEYRYHPIFFYTLARICNTNTTHVTLFTTEKILSLLEPHLQNKNEYTIILKKENESIHTFLKNVEKICNTSIDVLFVNTIQESCKDLPHFFGFRPRCKMILTLHNVNSWLDQKHFININIKRPLRTIDTLLSSFFINKYILPKFDGINVVYPPMKDYIQKNTTYSKEIYTFPFTFFDDKKPLHLKKKSSKITIVVPGAIEQPRRDYEILIDVFQKLYLNGEQSFSLYILGRPVGTYGKQIIKQFKDLQEKNSDIHLFEEFIPEETYDQVLSESDIILSPIILNAKGLGEVKEIYGLTKGTSSPFEAIQYAKPLIIPKDFIVLPELRSSTLQYTDAADLEKILNDLLIHSEKLERLQQDAVTNSNRFSLPVLQAYFEHNILKGN